MTRPTCRDAAPARPRRSTEPGYPSSNSSSSQLTCIRGGSRRWSTAVNDSKFGLQAGIFTRDLHKAREAWDRLEVGGLVVNDVSSMRVDNMPYGGVKDSGLGREGVRFAMEDMSEIRNLMIRRL